MLSFRFMKLYKFLFLNVISFVGYIDLFVVINFLFEGFFDKYFHIYMPLTIECNSFAFNNMLIPVYLLLFLIEYLLVKSKKLQPIVKINNRVYIAQFYINLVISLLSAIFYFWAVYRLSG